MQTVIDPYSARAISTGLTALSGVIELSETAPTLATMLGLAVGIDYALFILSRHRQNLGDGMELRESVAQSVATAGGGFLLSIAASMGLVVWVFQDGDLAGLFNVAQAGPTRS